MQIYFFSFRIWSILSITHAPTFDLLLHAPVNFHLGNQKNGTVPIQVKTELTWWYAHQLNNSALFGFGVMAPPKWAVSQAGMTISKHYFFHFLNVFLTFRTSIDVRTRQIFRHFTTTSEVFLPIVCCCSW